MPTATKKAGKLRIDQATLDCNLFKREIAMLDRFHCSFFHDLHHVCSDGLRVGGGCVGCQITLWIRRNKKTIAAFTLLPIMYGMRCTRLHKSRGRGALREVKTATETMVISYFGRNKLTQVTTAATICVIGSCIPTCWGPWNSLFLQFKNKIENFDFFNLSRKLKWKRISVKPTINTLDLSFGVRVSCAFTWIFHYLVRMAHCKL